MPGSIFPRLNHYFHRTNVCFLLIYVLFYG
nr:MAG TPA: hypothetical protein [Caudoviricetes sp.]